MEHHLEKIIHKKHFFIKSFIVSLILLIIVCMIATMAFDSMANMAYKLYGIDEEDYAMIFLTAFAFWKILILQFALVPAIVMGMVEKHMRKHIAEECKL